MNKKPEDDETRPLVRWAKPGSPAPFVCDFPLILAKGDPVLAQKIAMDVVKILNPWKFNEDKTEKEPHNDE